MSKFSRKKLYESGEQEEPYKISRSKIELFLNCPRCFYIDQKFGVKRPEFPAFTLNSAVDTLLKKEFDIHRAKKEAHPLMKKYGIKAIPFEHLELDNWRHNFTGIRYLHEPTNFLVYGAIDDIWINTDDEYHVVDYKATSKERGRDLEGIYDQAYKSQMEIYQWLFRRNRFNVSDTGYFVYVNGKRDREAFDAKLEFDVLIISYKGSDKWVENTIYEAKKCLDGDLHQPSEGCEYCSYRKAAAKIATNNRQPTTNNRTKKKVDVKSETLF